MAQFKNNSDSASSKMIEIGVPYVFLRLQPAFA